MLSSLVSMPPYSMVRCPEGEGKIAFIDRHAVATGKKCYLKLKRDSEPFTDFM